MFPTLTFPDPATPVMEGIIDLHTEIMIYLVGIFSFVCTIFGLILVHFVKTLHKPNTVDQILMRNSIFETRMLTHNTYLELVWTFIPTIILVIIAIPSFSLIYAIDFTLHPKLSVKAIGHQWYWSYEVLNKTSTGHTRYTSYDSNLIPEDALKPGELRLLTVDKALHLPTSTDIRILVTSQDVLHSWSVPAFGVKIDACPARLNQVFLNINRPGVFYGQCSELCGVNHGFMPITIISNNNII